MSINNRISVYIALLIILTVMVCFFRNIKHYLGAKRYEYTVSRPNERRLAISFQYIDKQLMDAKLHSLNDSVDFIRNFIHCNSMHLIDEEHGHYSGNTNLMLNRIVDVAKDSSNLRPHLSCGPRAAIFEKILTWYGIRNRVVQIYSDEYDDVRSHTFIEVCNPTDDTWHIQDADFNVYYQQTDGLRSDIFTLVYNNHLDSIIPVSSHKYGWEQHDLVFLKEKYFESVRVGNVVFINREKFNLNKTFPANNGITGQAFFDVFQLQCLKFSSMNEH